jgi:hypothetical protein
MSDWCFALSPLRGRGGIVAPQGAERFSVESVLDSSLAIRAYSGRPPLAGAKVKRAKHQSEGELEKVEHLFDLLSPGGVLFEPAAKACKLLA